MFRNSKTVREEINDEIREKFKNFLVTIFLPTAIFTIIICILIPLYDPEETLSINSFPTAIILGIGTIISLILIFHIKLGRYEIRRFWSILLFIITSFVGEIIYVYQQFFLGISIPYPSIADIFYLSANIFLSFHLYSTLIALKKVKNLKIKPITLIGLAISIIPLLYFAINIIYNFESNTISDIILFLTDFLYYILDVLLFAPSFIILSNLKNNSFMFHWVSITLGIAILVIGDLGYTYSVQISDELIVKTAWIWNILYAISYLFFIAALFWYVKIKRILEYKKINNILKSTELLFKKIDKLGVSEIMFKEDTPSEYIYDKKQVFNTLENMLMKAKEDVSIMITKGSFLNYRYLINFFKTNTQAQNTKNGFNIRILIPRYKIKEIDSLSPDDVKDIKIQGFDREIAFNETIVIVDHEYIFIIYSSPFEDKIENRYIAEFTNDRSKILVYTSIFERLWLSEKIIHFS
jgi:hypothetical protein